MGQNYRLSHERFRPNSHTYCSNSDYLCIMKQQTQFHIISGVNLLSELFPTQTGKRTLIGYVHFVLTLQGEAWVEIDGHNLHLQKDRFSFCCQTYSCVEYRKPKIFYMTTFSLRLIIWQISLYCSKQMYRTRQ